MTKVAHSTRARGYWKSVKELINVFISITVRCGSVCKGRHGEEWNMRVCTLHVLGVFGSGGVGGESWGQLLHRVDKKSIT